MQLFALGLNCYFKTATVLSVQNSTVLQQLLPHSPAWTSQCVGRQLAEAALIITGKATNVVKAVRDRGIGNSCCFLC